MVIAVNVAIVEVCLHAAVRSSGPVASVRSCPHRVKMRDAHVEHNESLTLIADVPSDVDFRRDGPESDIAAPGNLAYV
jgi:hypothetical protein